MESKFPGLGRPRIEDLVSVLPRINRPEVFPAVGYATQNEPTQENPLTLAKIREVMESMPPVPPLVSSTVIKSPHCFTTDEDWSRVRSPGRARRRRAKHRQNIVVTQLPAVMCIQGQLYAHPDLYEKLVERLKEQAAASIDEEMRMFTRGIFGGF